MPVCTKEELYSWTWRQGLRIRAPDSNELLEAWVQGRAWLVPGPQIMSIFSHLQLHKEATTESKEIFEDT